MADSSGDKKPNTVHMALGSAILLVLVALVIGQSYLSNPYYAIAEVVAYGAMVALVAVRLRSCLRLARDSEYSKKLKAVAFWLVLAVFAVILQFQSAIWQYPRCPDFLIKASCPAMQ